MCRSKNFIFCFLAAVICDMSIVMHPSRASAYNEVSELTDGPLAHNAKGVERGLAQCLHMINIGAVPFYAELRVMHCRTRTD